MPCMLCGSDNGKTYTYHYGKLLSTTITEKHPQVHTTISHVKKSYKILGTVTYSVCDACKRRMTLRNPLTLAIACVFGLLCSIIWGNWMVDPYNHILMDVIMSYGCTFLGIGILIWGFQHFVLWLLFPSKRKVKRYMGLEDFLRPKALEYSCNNGGDEVFNESQYRALKTSIK